MSIRALTNEVATHWTPSSALTDSSCFIKSAANVERRISCEATHIFMYETLVCEHAHLPGFPIGSGMFDWRSDIDLALAYERLVDLL
jgi:hypothetical protein